MRHCLLASLFFISTQVFGQVKIGSIGAPNPSSVLELDGGGTKGILIPKVTEPKCTTSISNPAQALLVYQTDEVVGFYVNRSSAPAIATISPTCRWSDSMDLQTTAVMKQQRRYFLGFSPICLYLVFECYSRPIV